MSGAPVNIVWTVIVGAVVFVVLAGALVISVVMSQRRRMALKQDMLDELRKSEERYRSLVENISEVYCVLNGERRVVYASPNLFTVTGLSQLEVMGEPYEHLIDRRDRSRVLRLLDAVGVRQTVDMVCEFRVVRRKRTSLWVEQNTRMIRNAEGEVTEYRNLLRDISERKANEEILRSISGRIIAAQESERRRVARDLHDGINQLLSSVQFRLKSIEEKRDVRPPALAKEVSEARELMESAIEEVRRISHNLRPTILDDFGLIAAVLGTCDEFEQRTHIATDVRTEGMEKRLPEHVELMLFRIIQEALTNVEKHSRATRVSLELVQDDSIVAVTIRDNGRGFDIAALAESQDTHRGLGLDGMRERAAALGGMCEIVARRRHGTEILLRIPVSQNGNHLG